jgi:hypothetical protein
MSLGQRTFVAVVAIEQPSIGAFLGPRQPYGLAQEVADVVRVVVHSSRFIVVQVHHASPCLALPRPAKPAKPYPTSPSLALPRPARHASPHQAAPRRAVLRLALRHLARRAMPRLARPRQALRRHDSPAKPCHAGHCLRRATPRLACPATHCHTEPCQARPRRAERSPEVITSRQAVRRPTVLQCV